jgi:hypothetical protein
MPDQVRHDEINSFYDFIKKSNQKKLPALRFLLRVVAATRAPGGGLRQSVRSFRLPRRCSARNEGAWKNEPAGFPGSLYSLLILN